MQAEAKDLRRTVKKFQETLAGHEAARLAREARGARGASEASGASGASREETLLIVEALDGWDANGLKAIASAITAGTRAAVALFSTTTPIAVVIARSAGVPIDANAILRALIERFGGRGGGKAELAQGGGFAGDLAEIRQAVRLLISDPS
jgi:alanyl-tRNA synthetase